MVVLGLLVMAGLIGCAGVDSIAKRNIINSKSEIIYGVGFLGIASEKNEIDEVCNAIKNADERCLDKENYKTVFVVSKVGYSDGPVGLIALAKNTDKIGKGCVSGSSDCTYYKVASHSGKLATIEEVVKNGNCHWSGLPRIGGVICEGVYDYHKDFNGVVR